MNEKNAYRLLIFDWDGTLMDSVGQIVACMHFATDDLGLERLPDEEIKNIIGLGLREAIDALLPGRDDAFHRRFVEQYRHHWLGTEGSSRLFPGVEPTLRELHERGYKMAVATGKGRIGLDKVFKQTGLGPLFAASRCSDESGSKPHPRMLEEIMLELDIAPDHALMIGDTEYDLEMACNAGVDSIGVNYGVHSVERLLKHTPRAMLADFRELLNLLHGIPTGAELASLSGAG